MFQNRDEIRQTYVVVWQKMRNSQALEPMEEIIANVIDIHKEYHPLLESADDAIHQEFNVDSGQSNPFLHMGLHIGLREQVFNDMPVGIKKIHRKLCKKKNLHDAEHQMIECLAQTLWLSQRDNTPPDMKLYLDCLKKL